PPRDVAALIDATMALYEALCGKPDPTEVPLALMEIRSGSCALEFRPSADAAPALVLIYDAIKTRAVNSPPEVRAAVKRLYEAGRVGPVQVRVRGAPG